SWDGAGGLRSLLARHEAGACEVPVVDEGILFDIDTAEDYRRMVERYGGRRFPAGQECDAILARQAVPEAVVRHSAIVAGVAREIAGRLNRTGLGLDEGLIAAAGLLHDLAKGRPNHPRRGARVLKSLGFPAVAEIVAVHHDIALAEGQPPKLDEAAIIYLADKLVKNDSIVSLDERFDCSREKFAADAAAQAAVTGRLVQAQRIAAEVEKALGIKLGEIVEDDFFLKAAGEHL
ncbi:MAG TPA: HD domain-containing protein, partial [Negativicutes bacterium]|nr:HD domain-containing protein [Negativicutes bacterium]